VALVLYNMITNKQKWLLCDMITNKQKVALVRLLVCVNFGPHQKIHRFQIAKAPQARSQIKIGNFMLFHRLSSTL
jgi:hypothetical protein